MILRMVLVGCWFLGLSLGTSLQAQNVIADSADDWSSEGTQGENNWFNGYYNFTDDEFNGDGVYQAEDFIEFENVDGPGGGPVAPMEITGPGASGSSSMARRALGPGSAGRIPTPTAPTARQTRSIGRSAAGRVI